MNSHEQVIELLNQVLDQQKEMNQAVRSIRLIKYRTFGRTNIEVSDDQKRLMVQAVIQKCNQKCCSIYNEINQIKRKEKLPELQNPYKN